MRLRFHGLAVAAALFLGVGLAAAERIPPVPPRYFNDYAGAVSPATADALNRQLEQYERESSNQLLVAIYPRMESDSSIEDYTVRVAQAWKAGQTGKSNGAVLFVFKNDRKLYIQVGYGLEATLTDAYAHDIVENILKPRFRQGDFDTGLREAVGAMIAATRGEYQGSGRTRADQKLGTLSPSNILVILVFVGVVIVFFRRAIGGGSRTLVLGNPLRRGALPWLIMGSGRSDNSRGSWGGGSGGGGFSGGGGSFGGGGAGGSW